MSATNKPKIYIAGPMRGLKNLNAEAFAAAKDYFIDRGWYVFSPADLAKELGEVDRPNSAEVTALDRKALAVEYKWICEKATAIYMLKGWENSKGAQAEWSLARVLNLQVIYQ